MTFIAKTLGSFLTAFVLIFTASLPASAALRLEQVDANSGSGGWGPYKTHSRAAASSYPGRVSQGAGTFLESGDPVSFKLECERFVRPRNKGRVAVRCKRLAFTTV